MYKYMKIGEINKMMYITLANSEKNFISKDAIRTVKSKKHLILNVLAKYKNKFAIRLKCIFNECNSKIQQLVDKLLAFKIMNSCILNYFNNLLDCLQIDKSSFAMKKKIALKAIRLTFSNFLRRSLTDQTVYLMITRRKVLLTFRRTKCV